MIVEFVGGRDDGLVLDFDCNGVAPGGWYCPEFENPPLPAVLQVHCAAANVGVYRMREASPERVVYVLDAAATERLRGKLLARRLAGRGN